MAKRKPVRRSHKGALGLAPAKAGLLGFAKGGVIPGHGIGVGKLVTAAAPPIKPKAKAKPPKRAPVLSESDILNIAEARRVRARSADKRTDRGILG